MTSVNVEKTIVVDASVMLRAFLRDEEDTAQVDRLLDDHAEGRLVVAAPTLMRYEVANALRTAAVRQRISAHDARDALRVLLQAPVDYYDSDALLEEAFDLSLRYGRSAYDSVYLALAQHLRVPLFTGDRKLYNALSDSFAWIRWIGDYHWDNLTAPSVG